MTTLKTAGVWPVIEDDDGSGTRGTPANEVSESDARRDAIDDQCHSATNTGIKPKATTDEVITAGGNTTLSGRENVHSFADGTVIIPSIFAQKAELQAALGGVNLVADDVFVSCWARGTDTLSGYWNLEGTGTIGQDSRGTDLPIKLSNTTGKAYVTQFILNAAEFAQMNDQLNGWVFGFGCWIKPLVNVANRWVEINDGADSTRIYAESGTLGTWTWISGLHRISADSTWFEIRMVMENATSSCSYWMPTVVLGPLAPTGWVPSRKSLLSHQWSFDGGPFVGDAQRHWGPQRPVYLLGLQGTALVAPGSGKNLTVQIERYSDAAWENIVTGNLITGTNKAGLKGGLIASKRCVEALQGTSNDWSLVRLNLDDVGDAADVDIYLRYLDWNRPFEEFIDFDRAGES